MKVDSKGFHAEASQSPTENSGHRACTDVNSLCYNLVAGQGQLLWVGDCLQNRFWTGFSMVSMVSINLRTWFYGVEMGEAGYTVEPEESQ